MRLDVVVPTYNRSGLLRKALASLLQARVPEGLQVEVLVVDNNSADDTEAVVDEIARSAPLPVRYIRERKQGLSHSRNAGISASHADLVGFIDDDEEIDTTWYEVVAREFADATVQFIGGPYLPNWASPAPEWLPPGYHAAIGAIPPKPRARFDEVFGANLMGGNAVMRRRVFDQVGAYSPNLGRSSKGLLSEEDAEFCRRLMAAGIQGMYVPDLIIHHYISPERLTRKYHRKWVFWRGISQGLLDREKPEAVAYFARVPRYKIGRALRALFAMPRHQITRRGKAQAFADELASWDLAGFVYGKFFFDPQRYYAEKGGKT